MPSFPHPRAGQVLTHGKEPFDFIIYAGSSEDGWARMLASNPWRCIELALRTANQMEAKAFLVQARDFFNAADNAGPTSRPLLFYYGFLNLAKSLIKAKSPHIDLTAAFHGIQESGDNKTAQRFRLTSQSVEIQGPRPNKANILNEFARAVGWQTLATGHEYFVCDLLSQIPAVHRAYKHIRGEPEKLHPVENAEFRFDQPTRRLWALVRVKKIGPKGSHALAQLKSRHYFSGFFHQRESDAANKNLATFESTQVAYAQNPRSALHELGHRCRRAGVCALLTANGYRHYFSDFQPAARVECTLASYMAMFYFGSVARYRPAHLEKILAGDYAWVIEEFLSAGPKQFLYAVTSLLLDREVVRPMALL